MSPVPPHPALPRRRVVRGLALAPLLPALAPPAWSWIPGMARAAGGATLSAAQARADLQLLRRAFDTLHPGLHRRATPAQVDASFAAAERAVAGGSTQTGLFLLCSSIAGAVNCGHTWANPINARADLKQRLFAGRDKLPFTLRWVQGRALVTGSATSELVAGSELLAIDDRPVAEIAATLLPMLRADGQHAGAVAKRWAQLDSGPGGGAMDWLFPLCFPSEGGRWRIRLRERPLQAGSPARDIAVPAATLAERERSLPVPARQWSFDRERDTALLRLPTFAFASGDFKTEAFLARTFVAIRQSPYLVIDLRDNEGGDDNIARQVLAHLLRAPYQPPAVRLESAYAQVADDLLPHLNSWDRSFFDRRGQATALPGGRWLLPGAAAVPVQPVSTPYPGRTVALVGPQNSSAGFLFARDLQRSGAAVLVGQPTAGHQGGLNGGQIAWLQLPASGVAVDIPLRASFTLEEDGEAPPDHGVLPEVVVAPRFEDAAAGTDAVLLAAGELIVGWRPNARPRAVAPTS